MKAITKVVILSGCMMIGLFTQPYRIAKVKGCSMEPTLHDGSTVIVQQTQDVEPGDIIVYLCHLEGYPRYIIHRVAVKGKDGTMIMQGDNNPAPDIVTPCKEDIVGKVVWR